MILLTLNTSIIESEYIYGYIECCLNVCLPIIQTISICHIPDNEKYKFNRGERQVARQDVPLAIMAQSEEELKLQKENFERLEKLNKLWVKITVMMMVTMMMMKYSSRSSLCK